MIATRMRAVLISIGLVAVAMVPGLAIAEFVSRAVYPKMVEKLIDVDHRMPPNRRGTNADGVLSKVDPNDLRAEDVNVIVLGDSFARGVRMGPEDALPQRLERMARAVMPRKTINVLNFGWVSSSPYLSQRLLRDIGSKYKPDAVILLVDATDFYDDMAHRKYIEKQGIYALIDYVPGLFYVVRTAAKRVLSGQSLESLFGLPANRFFAYDRPLSETRPFLTSITDSINEIAAFTHDQLDARFYLVLSARHFQYSDRESPGNWENDSYTMLGPLVFEPNRYFEEQFGHREFAYFSLLPAFQATTVFPTTFEDDPHWTDAGTQVAAEAVFAFCVRHGCFD